MPKLRILKRTKRQTFVVGPDDDGQRSIEKLLRDNRRIASLNKSMTDLFRQMNNISSRGSNPR